MAYPRSYAATVAIPLPSEQTVQQMFGKSYDSEMTLNVLKMFAGTEDMFEPTIGIVKAMFQAKRADPKTREDGSTSCREGAGCAYEAQAYNVKMAKNAPTPAAEIDAAAPMVRYRIATLLRSRAQRRLMNCQRCSCAM